MSNSTTEISWKKARKEFNTAFAADLEKNEPAQRKLANYRTNPEPFIKHIRDFAAKWGDLYKEESDHQIVQVATRELGRVVKTGKAPQLAAAFGCFKIARFMERNAKRNFLEENEITKAYRDNPDRIYSADGVDEIFLPKLPTSFPPHGKWICESEAIHDLWDYHLRFDPKADNRLPRHEPIVINEAKLAKVIGAETSCIIRDPNTPTNEIVLVVLRSCFNMDIGEWLDGVIEEATDTRRNIRRDDEGDLVMIGLSAGARSKPAFHWVRNLLRKHSDEQISEFDRKQCSAFAFFWNWLRCHIPRDVRNNFDLWMNNTMIPRMTPEWQTLSKLGSYTVDLPGYRSLLFNNVELAPPAGVMASNYARPMHYEKQPHEYAVAFTVRRSASPTDGGHFYLGSYGIKVEAAANSIVIWRPKDVHGTSLQNRHPYDSDPDFIQRGMAIVTSNRLTNVWLKYAPTLGFDIEVLKREAEKAEREIYGGSEKVGLHNVGVDEIYA